MRITIIAHPNSQKPRIGKDLFGTLHIYVSAPPLKNQANEAIIESLADYFHTKRNRISLVSGEKSKHKTFEILK